MLSSLRTGVQHIGMRYASTFVLAETPALPIQKSPEEMIIKRAWAVPPHPFNVKLEVPVYDLMT